MLRLRRDSDIITNNGVRTDAMAIMAEVRTGGMDMFSAVMGRIGGVITGHADMNAAGDAIETVLLRTLDGATSHQNGPWQASW